jgi:acyl-CoA thioester hydrolase
MHDVSHLFQVMTYDIDYGGIVSNIVYIRWLEDLRTLLASRVLSIEEVLKRGIAPALGRTEIDYLAPVRFPDQLEGRMWMIERGRARFVLSAEFKSRMTGMLTTRAKQTGVFVSLSDFRPVPLPSEFLKFDVTKER